MSPGAFIKLPHLNLRVTWDIEQLSKLHLQCTCTLLGNFLNSKPALRVSILMVWPLVTSAMNGTRVVLHTGCSFESSCDSLFYILRDSLLCGQLRLQFTWDIHFSSQLAIPSRCSVCLLVCQTQVISGTLQFSIPTCNLPEKQPASSTCMQTQKLSTAPNWAGMSFAKIKEVSQRSLTGTWDIG